MTVEAAGTSALGRAMYRVTINALDTNARQEAFRNWEQIKRVALSDPARALERLDRADGEVKVPIFIQGGIHGNEYEGVDAAMQLIEKLATTPARRRPRGRRDPRPRRRRLQPDPEPRWACRRHAHERQRLRSQPRLPDPVAVGDEGVDRDHARVAAARGARPARLRDADADRGDDEATQPEHRIRPLAEVEPRPDRRQRGRAERGGAPDPAADQRLVLGCGPAAGVRRLPRRRPARARRGRGLGRLGPVLHGDVRAARRARLVDGRDVPERHLVRRPRRRPSRAVRDELVDVRVRRREPRGAARGPARDLPPRRRERAEAGVLPASVRRRQQLDDRVSARLRDSARRGPAQRPRSDPPRPVAARQPDRRRGARPGHHLRGPDVRAGLLRGLDEPGTARARRHGARHRRRRLEPDQHPLRAAGGLEPRLPVGRHGRHDPTRRCVLAADGRDPATG